MKNSAHVPVEMFLISGRKTYKKGMAIKRRLERIKKACEKENMLRTQMKRMMRALPPLMDNPLSIALEEAG